ncbi:MHC class II regulatory factor RFX1 isoform X3 [Ornithorhynchus anatinus]|uniref:MHC class II regulatory factor RFX1 isoform X3 n=1 Tax=Ornithorhynchus anatinus TaxID=9258 RepID=UPI0010A78E24|nr:MHC class II regulatory factor RFX1 isoform X3 [Ornithorhynchus anatinus]
MRDSDTLHKSSPSSTASQSGVPIQVIQQVQVMQQHLVFQNSAQLNKGDQISLADRSMQEMSRTPEQVQELQQEPVQQVHYNQVQFVEDVVGRYTANPENQVVTKSSAKGRGGSCDRNEAGAYVIQGGFILDRSIQSYSHPTRASPATVQWLQDNYETAEGESLPRSTLYCHYLLHCQEQKLEPVNSASLGKLIRCIFIGLRTRRLGTRGNSKYHYYGLRIKAGSPLLHLTGDQKQIAMQGQPFSQKQGLNPIQKVDRLISGVAECQQQESGLSDINSQIQQYQHFLDASWSLPDFTELDLQGQMLPEGIEVEDVKAFQILYREHCEAIINIIINLKFTLLESLWKTFWRYNLIEGPFMVIYDEAEKRLPKNRLVILSKYKSVLRWTKDCDILLYQGLVEILIPDVLRPIPSVLMQAIRNFAKSLESWLTNAMINIPEEMVCVKEQASWVGHCENNIVQQLEQDFKVTLQQQNSLEQWASWLDCVVSQVLKPYQGTSSFPKAAKLFLLKWSFYSSLVIRDLTLRSAASFGSFHLIRLLCDEYMYYLVEHRVAQDKSKTPIAVMGEFASLASSLDQLNPEKDEEEEEEAENKGELAQKISSNFGESTLNSESLEPATKLLRIDGEAIFLQPCLLTK